MQTKIQVSDHLTLNESIKGFFEGISEKIG